jgi:hypothetical protein
MIRGESVGHVHGIRRWREVLDGVRTRWIDGIQPIGDGARRSLSTSVRHISQEIAEAPPLGRRAC